MAWQGVGVNQGPAAAGTNYPLTGVVPAVQYLFGDLLLSYFDPTGALVWPFYITQLTNFDADDAGRKDLVIKDSNGVVVFDTTTALTYKLSPWGASLYTLCWIGERATLRCTAHNTPPLWAPGQTWAASIATHAQLDSRCIYRLPPHLHSLYVTAADGTKTVFANGCTYEVAPDGAKTVLAASTGHVVLTQGFNIQLTPVAAPSNDGGRRTNQLQLRARPGDGQGRVPGCTGAPVGIQTINAIPPTARGDFTLDTDGCYRLQRPVTITQDQPRQASVSTYAGLQFYNDCSPCCSCQDFINTYEGLRRLFLRYQRLGRRAEGARDQLQANINRWNAQKACRALQSLNLVLDAEPAGVLYVAGLQCNQTSGCATNLTLRTTIQTFNTGTATTMADVQLHCREQWRAGADTQGAEELYTPTGAFPVLDTLFDSAAPQSTSKYRMRLALVCNSNNKDVVTVTVTAHLADGSVVDPSTGTALPLPAPITPPAGVTALWTGATVLPPVRAMISQTIPITNTSGAGSNCTT